MDKPYNQKKAEIAFAIACEQRDSAIAELAALKKAFAFIPESVYLLYLPQAELEFIRTIKKEQP